MSAETTLRDALLALPAVMALVDDRVFPVTIEEGVTEAAIAYQRTQTEYTNTIGNVAVASKVVFDVLCVDGSFTGAEAICDAAEGLLLEKLNRAQTYDPDVRKYVSVLTVAVWI